MSGVDLRVNSTKSILKENIEEFEKRNQVLSSLVDNLCVKANDLHEKYLKKKKNKQTNKEKRWMFLRKLMKIKLKSHKVEILEKIVKILDEIK